MYSEEHINYLKKERRRKRIILLSQISIIIILLLIWQILVNFRVINSFLFSSPYNILETLLKFPFEVILEHILITTYETLISFSLATIVGILIASLMWLYKSFASIINPYLTMINSLPKVALGPLIIIWFGTGMSSIVIMALSISLFLSIINLYNSFISTDENYIKLLKSFNANKVQIFFKIILPANKINIFNTIKINISMSLIGVIMGELLTSKKGLGYLIMYGSQVFNISLVITSVFILEIISYIIYIIIRYIENKVMNKRI